MRRGQDSESGQVSAGASKATSEAGSDGKDGKGKGATPNQKYVCSTIYVVATVPLTAVQVIERRARGNV